MSQSKAKKIKKLLVANRGEIAGRVFNTCRVAGVHTVAVYSEADARAPHRFAADESVCIGPAAASASYLNVDAILDAARETGSDAIHPGYGFLSENADFARRVEEAGLSFVGPTAEHIDAMGDKVRAREIMKAAGVPVIPGTDDPVSEESALVSAANEVGYPLLVKAAGGGGGKGIRQVDRAEDLVSNWKRAVSEARSAFGDPRVYLERKVFPARHIEAQVFGDGRGGAMFLGERDCSLQRRHQKLVEETPSPVISEETRQQFREAALNGVRALQYRGAGTMEFLYDAQSKEFFFLEMNTRLQVEHPVSEMVTRKDLVAEQLRIAEGGVIDETRPEPQRLGCSIEFRVYAEDPFRGFVPSTGIIDALRLPQGPFVRVDAALRRGYEVSPFYDPLLAKVIVWGETRREAIARLRGALSRMRIGGIHTTIPLGIQICDWDEFVSGEFHTGSLEAWLKRDHTPTEAPPLQVQLAAIVARAQLESTSRRTRTETPTARASGWAWAAKLEGLGH